MSWLGWLLGIGLVAGVVGWLRRQFVVVTVSGPSMDPTYRDGDRLLAVRRPAATLRAGQVVVADLRICPPGMGDQSAAASLSLSGQPQVIKRVAAVAGEPVPPGVDPAPTVPPGMLVLLGDNPPASVDSRHYGYVAAKQVVGVVLRRLR